ncbi:NmrA-like family domain-containing protein 1 [Fulvia fulva]|uniref:NmrA-like family domain-containing protein 1 n=1 Tax=Passalora fulva TaxID=5499 RepID=A0A9Q8P969_PASFU|nr:NmrA-like family domain-containing protein 1 [Fulvia fulva]KAK4623886.1 NmrA-like family domain-containing protein 1 [Fulvia fulva]KAK4625764.1 NmrA-like family domain-containing protein 1 [Fulvia fulva]UJO17747.1 NmrA-like family domain-containing protein 1 [Fulvia fulva]WPV14652.1 NmrA-like family domain-containing protein 1 [Fulvia fulva]WPV30545.1 NmrA-like family domain-containing protein 1 [Fulvia fulva]
MSPKLIVVTGVTGIQGGSVARFPDWRVRGITRNPDKASNASLREAGIELVAGDYDDVTSLERAYVGADVIFVNEIAFEREVQQGKNVAQAVSTQTSTLHRFALSTLSDSKCWSNDETLWNLHFDGKACIANYLKQTYPERRKDELLPDRGVPQ